jgi:hypothetical protein
MCRLHKSQVSSDCVASRTNLDWSRFIEGRSEVLVYDFVVDCHIAGRMMVARLAATDCEISISKKTGLFQCQQTYSLQLPYG